MSRPVDPTSFQRSIVSAESVADDELEYSFGQDVGTRHLKKEELRWPEQAKLLNSVQHVLECKFQLPRGTLSVAISLKDVAQPSAILRVAAGLSLQLCDPTVSEAIYSKMQADARAFIESMQQHEEPAVLTTEPGEDLVEAREAHQYAALSGAALATLDLGAASAPTPEPTDSVRVARAMVAGRKIARPFLVSVGEGPPIELSDRFHRDPLPGQKGSDIVVRGEIDTVQKKRLSFTFLMSSPREELEKKLTVFFEPAELPRVHELHLRSDVMLTVQWTRDYKPNGLPGDRFKFIAVETFIASDMPSDDLEHQASLVLAA